MRKFLFILLLILCSSPPIQAGQNIVIVIDWGNPPYMFEQDGEVAGFYPTLITAVFDRMGRKAVVKAYPWKRALEMGENGDVGIGGIYKTAKRLKIYDYSTRLYTESVLVYVTPKNTFAFNTLSDLEGKTIGALRGWSFGDAFDHFRQEGKVKIIPVNNDNVSFKRLVDGHMDCIFAPKLTGSLMMRQKEYKDKIVALKKPVAVNDTYLVFAKRSRKKKLLDQFNATLKAMKDDGVYNQVIQSCLEQGK